MQAIKPAASLQNDLQPIVLSKVELNTRSQSV